MQFCFGLFSFDTVLFHKHFPLVVKTLGNTNFRAFITCYPLAVPRYIKPSPLSGHGGFPPFLAVTVNALVNILIHILTQI